MWQLIFGAQLFFNTNDTPFGFSMGFATDLTAYYYDFFSFHSIAVCDRFPSFVIDRFKCPDFVAFHRREYDQIDSLVSVRTALVFSNGLRRLFSDECLFFEDIITIDVSVFSDNFSNFQRESDRIIFGLLHDSKQNDKTEHFL